MVHSFHSVSVLLLSLSLSLSLSLAFSRVSCRLSLRFHILHELSLQAVISRSPFGVYKHVNTSAECGSTLSGRQSFKSPDCERRHVRTEPSSEQVANSPPSGLKTSHNSGPRCPRNTALWHSSLPQSHRRAVPSALAVPTKLSLQLYSMSRTCHANNMPMRMAVTHYLTLPGCYRYLILVTEVCVAAFHHTQVP